MSRRVTDPVTMTSANAGGSNSRSRLVTVVAPPMGTILAADNFSRAVVDLGVWPTLEGYTHTRAQ